MMPLGYDGTGHGPFSRCLKLMAPPKKKTKRPLRVEETGRWQMPHEGGGPGNLGIFTRLNEQFLGNPKLSFILGTNKYPLVN